MSDQPGPWQPPAPTQQPQQPGGAEPWAQAQDKWMVAQGSATWAFLANALASLVGSLGSKPPTPFVPDCCERPSAGNYWAALGAAQKDAKELDPQGEVKHGNTHYEYAGYRQYVREARRVLHAAGLIVQQTGGLSAENDNRRRTALSVYHTVVHIETGEGVCYPFDWSVAATDKWAPAKATGASYSNALRYFLRGLLQINDRKGAEHDPEQAYDGGRSDYNEGANPNWPGQQQGNGGRYQQQQQQQGYQQPGYQQQGQQYQNTHHDGPPQGGQQHPGQQRWNESLAPPQQQPQRQGGQPPQGQRYQSFEQQPRVENDSAMRGKERQLRADNVQRQDPPSTQLAWDPASGQEPQGGDEWSSALQWAGYSDAFAEDLALQDLSQQIHDGVRDTFFSEVERFFGTEPEAQQRAMDAWQGTGFVPDLTADPPPRPTGLQVCRYVLNNMNRNTQQ